MENKFINRYNTFCRCLENLKKSQKADPEADFVLEGTVQNFNLAFDISWKVMKDILVKNMGITDVFDYAKSDFTPTTNSLDEVYVSKAQHDVRVAIDEEGVTAAAYTAMMTDSGAAPPQDLEEINFILDKPFIFVISGADSVPLFVGVVNQPGV